MWSQSGSCGIYIFKNVQNVRLFSSCVFKIQVFLSYVLPFAWFPSHSSSAVIGWACRSSLLADSSESPTDGPPLNNIKMLSKHKQACRRLHSCVMGGEMVSYVDPKVRVFSDTKVFIWIFHHTNLFSKQMKSLYNLGEPQPTVMNVVECTALIIWNMFLSLCFFKQPSLSVPTYFSRQFEVTEKCNQAHNTPNLWGFEWC